MPRADVDRAVAELAQHGLWLAVTYERERDAGGDGKLAADDPPATEEAALDVEQVHRAAAAVSAPVTRPNSSAMTASGSTPRASARPWSR